MNKDKIKETIVQIITDSTGIKATELAIKIVEKTIPESITADMITNCIGELVKEHKIHEIAFVLPQMSYRIKSIYFPIGTTFYLDRNE